MGRVIRAICKEAEDGGEEGKRRQEGARSGHLSFLFKVCVPSRFSVHFFQFQMFRFHTLF